MNVDELLASYPPSRGSYPAESTDADMLTDLREWAESARLTLLRIREDAERVKTTIAELDMVKLLLDEIAPVQTDAGYILPTTEQVKWLRDDRDAQRGRANEAESNLSELHIQLRQTFGAESVAEAFELVNEMKAQRDAFMQQQDAALTMLGATETQLADTAAQRDMCERQRDSLTSDAEGWRVQCASHERTISRLAAKVIELTDELEMVDKKIPKNPQKKKRVPATKPAARRKS